MKTNTNLTCLKDQHLFKPSQFSKLAFSFCLILLFWSYHPAKAMVPASTGRLQIDNDHISASLDSTPLGIILHRLWTQQGIWYDAEENILRANVSVAFEDLPIDKGIYRILSRMNFSIFYRNNGEIEGILILGHKESINRINPVERSTENRLVGEYPLNIRFSPISYKGSFEVNGHVETPAGEPFKPIRYENDREEGFVENDVQMKIGHHNPKMFPKNESSKTHSENIAPGGGRYNPIQY